MSDKLIQLYEQTSNLTSPVCESQCLLFRDKRYRCCDRKYCEMSRKFAKDKYDVDLQDTGNPDLPFMGESGCIVPPHLRPLCTLHMCPISWQKECNLPAEQLAEYFSVRRELLEEARVQRKLPDWK